MNYVNESDLERYKKIFKKENVADIDPIKFANWFIESAITTLSNHIYDHFDNGNDLQYNIAEGCRCMGCHEWQFVDENNKVVDSAESLADFVMREKNSNKS